MSNPIVVIKFGGMSIGTAARLRRAAARIRSHVRSGRSPVVVASALGHTTDHILGQLRKSGISPGTAGREVDRALATGEVVSSAVLAGRLQTLELPGLSLTGGEAGLEAEGDFGEGTISHVNPGPLRRLVQAGMIPVVAGFQARRADGETLTLGRGASDTTAVAIAAALGSVPCHIVTDVDAVYDCDPKLVSAARPYADLSHAELVRLAEDGARVMHPAAARWALKHSVPLSIYSYRAPFGERCGTTVTSSAEQFYEP